MRLDGLDAAAVDDAAARLAAGELVAFPTETVYGLGARADSDAAVAKIFALKGRPTGHPLIVHVADRAGAERFGAISPVAERLVDAFWPGPLTVIVAAPPGVADAAAAGQATIGLRCPAHPVAHALLAKAAEPACPASPRRARTASAASARPRAAHVADEFGDALPVLDGGAARIGIESAIVDCSTGRPVLLRPGILTRAGSRTPPASRCTTPTRQRRARPARSPRTTRRGQAARHGHRDAADRARRCSARSR